MMILPVHIIEKSDQFMTFINSVQTGSGQFILVHMSEKSMQGRPRGKIPLEPGWLKNENRSLEGLIPCIVQLNMMELIRLKYTDHPGFDGITFVIDDHRAFALVNQQYFETAMGMKSFLVFVPVMF